MVKIKVLVIMIGEKSTIERKENVRKCKIKTSIRKRLSFVIAMFDEYVRKF